MVVAVPELSRRNRLTLTAFSFRANLRFAGARVARLDWAALAHSTLAAFAVLGGCHSAAHAAEFRTRMAQAAPTGPAPA